MNTMNASEATPTAQPRYRVSKKAIHLDAGWLWLVYDVSACDFVDGEVFQSQEQAARRAKKLNAEAGRSR